MAIQLTYGDSFDSDRVDRAIVATLGTQMKGYVIELTTGSVENPRVQDVMIDPFGTGTGGILRCRAYSERRGEPFGPMFTVETSDILSIKIY